MRTWRYLAVGLALGACDPPANRAETAPQEVTPARPTAPGQVPLQARIDASLPELELAWAAEARSLALRRESGAAGGGFLPGTTNDASTSEWGSETESRLQALLLAPGPARRWATFGLGLRCEKKSERLGSALITAISSWFGRAEGPEPELLEVAGWALGACASPAAEEALRSWLDPGGKRGLEPLVHAAAVGLGLLADRRGELTEQTQAALLDAAISEKKPALLYPLSRVTHLSDAVGARLLEVAGQLLGEPTPERRILILALASAGPLAGGPLGQVLLSSDYSPAERSAAALALGRIGPDGQKVLDETLRDLLRRGLPTKADSDLWAPLRAALLALDLPTLAVGELRKLTSLQLPEAPEPLAQAQRRRLLWLRCRAADLIARDRSLSGPLLTCDPDRGEVFQLAQINVLGRSRIEAQRLPVFEDLARSSNPRVAQAALRLIPGHPEVGNVAPLLAAALETGDPGTQATAAKIIAAYPMRASHSDPKSPGPDPRILERLRSLLEEGDRLPDETLTSAISAAGALGALTLKPAVEGYCNGDRPALLAPAERTLSLLGAPKTVCSGPAPPKPPAPDAPAPSPRPAAETVQLEFQSDFGPLRITLDDPESPATQRQIVELAQGGHYTSFPVHQTSPGNALQFGDPNGDGYDDRRPTVAEVELSPAPFSALSVGVSSSSELSPGSQLFIALAEAPQLRGRRVRVGRAEGAWHLLWPGDPLHGLRIDRAPAQD